MCKFVLGATLLISGLLAAQLYSADMPGMPMPNMPTTASMPASMPGMPSSMPASMPMKMMGILIDSKCAATFKGDAAAMQAQATAHPKSCLMMPDCLASGLNLMVDGKLMKLDPASTDMAKAYLARNDATSVAVNCTCTPDGTCTLTSIDPAPATK